MSARRQPTSRSTASGRRCAARRMALLLLSGLTFANAMPAVTMAQDTPVDRSSTRNAYADYIACGGESGAREAGKWRLEGKDYIVQEGDVMHFRFNV